MELKLDLPDDIAATLKRRAAEHAMTPEALLTDLLHRHLQDMAETEAAIAVGEADVAAGRVVSLEDAIAQVSLTIEAVRRRRA